MPDRPQTPDDKLQQEFNRRAVLVKAEDEESSSRDHEKTIRADGSASWRARLGPWLRTGWATRLLARLVGDGPEGFGQVVGVDISDEMVRQARESSKDFENILYVWGSAQQIPWEENFFDKVLSVESFYYYADQDRAADGVVSSDGAERQVVHLDQSVQGQSYSLQWVDKLKVPVHVRSSAEYIELFKRHAFENVEARRIPDDTPTPDDYKTKSFNSLRRFACVQTGGRVAADGIKARRLPVPQPRDTQFIEWLVATPSRPVCGGSARCHRRKLLSGRSDFAVVIVVIFVVVTAILHRAHGMPILRMVNLDPAVYVRQFYALPPWPISPRMSCPT